MLRASPAESTGTDMSRPFVMGATVILLAAAAVAVLARRAEIDADQVVTIRTVAGTGTVLSASGVFVLSRATWRQIGDRAALWAGCGALVIGVAAASRSELAGALLGEWRPDERWLTAVSAAGLTVAPLLFGAGLVSRLGRLPVSAASLTGGALAVVAALAALFRAAPELGTALSVSQLTRGEGLGGVFGGVVVLGIWLGLAVGYTVRGLGRRWLYTWAGLMLFALTLAALAAGAAGPTNSWAVGAVLIESIGVMLAMVGSHFELTRAYENQAIQLIDSALEAETAEVRARVRAGAVRAQRHDLVNAIMAIDGAAVILEREFDRLSPDDREMLAGVVGSGTARLRRLLAQDSSATAPVSMADTAVRIADDPAWSTQLKLDVTPDLLAIGSAAETAEAVRQLVDYASRRSRSGPVTLRGDRDGPWVVLRVEDDGPTMPRELRRTLTNPDARREPGREDAMSVQVAAKLMRAQGGDLWIEPRPGGGTSFGICLPAITAGTEDEGAVDA
ncbi:MAG TPA: HAMP domain-containing sensor histidine kinase [Acidimicrobiales bacterium]|nr:HAMP domain-containing sensor histidine kinase [Acidimicrobiales bacterium]